MKTNGLSPPVNLARAARALNAEIVYEEMPDKLRGITLPIDGRYVVAVNNRKPHKQKRFAISHELGHIFLGHLDGGAGHEPTDILDKEADTFAAELLRRRQA